MKKEKKERKGKCIAHQIILCGEVLKVVEEKQDEGYQVRGRRYTRTQAVEMKILGK